MRTIIPFNSGWLFKKTDEVPAAYPQEGWERVTLPHTWNAVDGQDGGNDYWRGTAMYVKRFEKPDLPEKGRLVLELQGAANTSEVFLNGTKLGHHEDGFSTFRVDLTADLQEENLLAITCDNSENDHVYPQKADFTFYGGLYRDVNLIEVPEHSFELIRDGMPGIRVTPQVREDGTARVEAEAFASGNGAVTFETAGQTVTVSLAGGKAQAVFEIERPHLWNGVDDPYLYTMTAVLAEDGEELDRVSTRYGIRSFRIDPEKGFFLNGRSYPLRGVSKHQDRKGKGNAVSPEDLQEDMSIVKELGANTLRLAHYQHAQEFYDLCDENGIIVWAEIPFITQYLPKGRQNTLDQMRELVVQNYNHPSIVCWGLSNEITAASVVTDDLLDNLRALNDLCHSLDATRVTTMAHVFMLEKDSPIIPIADVGSWNLYFGWYLGELADNDAFFDAYHRMYPDRCIGFSEYGADTNIAFHSDSPERGDYTEEYECIYHEHMLQMIDARPYLWATHVWNLFDFAADGRDEGGKRGENQKGLVTFDRKIRKDAFYLYKAAWSRIPFVHICGSRYVDRTGETTKIKVYSNLPEVTLLVNGKEVETKKGSRVFGFEIRNTGEQRITAKAGDCTDEIRIRKVEKANPGYSLLGDQAVVNWFDKDTYDPSCYSVKDSLGEIGKNPEAAKLLAEISKKAAASRGDVAAASGQNANLQKMMAGMSLEKMLKAAGPKVITPEQIGALNRALQQIRKG